jgi:hypothetical protein
MTSSGDPIDTGAVGSLPYPGGNVTGVSALIVETSGKRIELLKEAVPTASESRVLLDMGNPAVVRQWRITNAVATSMKLVPSCSTCAGRDDIGRAIERAARDHANAMLVGRGAVALHNARQIADLAVRYRLPTMFSASGTSSSWRFDVYGVNTPSYSTERRPFVDKIFKGASRATCRSRSDGFRAVDQCRHGEPEATYHPRPARSVQRADHLPSNDRHGAPGRRRAGRRRASSGEGGASDSLRPRALITVQSADELVPASPSGAVRTFRPHHRQPLTHLFARTQGHLDRLLARSRS